MSICPVPPSTPSCRPLLYLNLTPTPGIDTNSTTRPSVGQGLWGSCWSGHGRAAGCAQGRALPESASHVAGPPGQRGLREALASGCSTQDTFCLGSILAWSMAVSQEEQRSPSLGLTAWCGDAEPMSFCLPLQVASRRGVVSPALVVPFAPDWASAIPLAPVWQALNAPWTLRPPAPRLSPALRYLPGAAVPNPSNNWPQALQA